MLFCVENFKFYTEYGVWRQPRCKKRGDAPLFCCLKTVAKFDIIKIYSLFLSNTLSVDY